MEKLTFTPSEFAALFGKERTWAYRQLKAGKVQAITELGRTLIPKSEVDRLLKEAGRYLGMGAKVGQMKEPPAAPKVDEPAARPNRWADALKRRMRCGKRQ